MQTKNENGQTPNLSQTTSQLRLLRSLEKLKDITYTCPRGTKFVFPSDVEKELLSPEQFVKWREVSTGSTCLIVADQFPAIYLSDIEKFLRLDAEGK